MPRLQIPCSEILIIAAVLVCGSLLFQLLTPPVKHSFYKPLNDVPVVEFYNDDVLTRDGRDVGALTEDPLDGVLVTR